MEDIWYNIVRYYTARKGIGRPSGSMCEAHGITRIVSKIDKMEDAGWRRREFF